MKKIIRKYLNAGILSLNLQYPQVTLTPPQIPYSYYLATNTPIPDYTKLNQVSTNTGNLLGAAGILAAGNILSGVASDKIFGDSEMGRVFGTLMGSAVSSGTNTLANNFLTGTSLTLGLSKNIGSSLSGAGAGLAANYIGLGITSAMGDSKAGKALGAGTATALGTIGGQALSNLSKFGKIGQLFGKGAGMINPYGFAAQVIGSALGAAAGPSKEYGGKYGTGVMIADTAYDVATAAVNAVPVAGQFISGMMALNKGISNIFGSTDGMTLQDSILGSAWLGAPLKWLNMAGARTTDTFKNQSWLNTEKTNAFMLNAFGDLSERFDKAREEAGKTYGTFSRKAYNRALANLDFANNAWGKILDMTDLNEIQNIRSQLMSSVNNQKYAQDIQGGWNPVYRGKLGMKILNNATNHKIGMRLLSGAALVDSKQMILCGAVD